jgi:hypothetical protein
MNTVYCSNSSFRPSLTHYLTHLTSTPIEQNNNCARTLVCIIGVRALLSYRFPLSAPCMHAQIIVRPDCFQTYRFTGAAIKAPR